MSVVAEFQNENTGNSFSFKEVEGYRISAALAKEGFGDRFFVYILDRNAAKHKITNPLGFEERMTGTLKIVEQGKAGAKRSYVFNNIELRNQEVGVTRKEKYRLLEFSYDRETSTVRSGLPVTLENNDAILLPQGELMDDYRYKLSSDGSDTWEHLLGFSMRASFNEATVMRFASLRNKHNSFVQSAVNLHNQIVGPDSGMEDLTVFTSLAEFLLTDTSLNLLYVEEAYGDLLKYPSPMLSQAAEDSVAKVVRQAFGTPNAETYLRHDAKSKFELSHVAPGAVEIATIVCPAGTFRDVVIA